MFHSSISFTKKNGYKNSLHNKKLDFKRVYHNNFIKGLCTDDCPSTINPVCGTNGMTYFNICLLERSSAALGEGQSIEKLHNGPCACKNFSIFHLYFSC